MYKENLAHYLVVTGIVIKEGKYLITKRSKNEKAFPGQWTVPGGKLEKSDYANRPMDTNAHWYNIFEGVVRREVREETGLEIEKLGYVTSLAYMRSDNIPTVIISLYGYYKSGEIVLEESLTDYAWVSLEQAKEYNLIEGIYEELEILDNYLKGGELGVWNNKKQ